MAIDPRIIAWEQHARHARTSTSVLDLGAWIGLIAGCAFWGGFFWDLIAPRSIPETLLTCALAAGYSVVLPMLISLLAPSTPAGMALAETRWRTFGHALSVGAALFMAYHALTVLWAWFVSRPAVAHTGQDLYLAIGTAIITIVVPALAWVQIAPDRWVAEIAQAQQVKRLKAAQEANLMAARLQYARAMALLKRGLANATAAERQELAGTLIAMQRAENEAIGHVADGLRLLTGIDTNVPMLDDPHLLGQYEQLTGQMERLIAPINEANYVEAAPALSSGAEARLATNVQQARASTDREYAHLRAPAARPDAVSGGSWAESTAPAAGRQGPSGAAAGAGPISTAVNANRWYAVARRELRGAWKRVNLEQALSISKTQANDLISEWRDRGMVVDVTKPAYHYAWTDEED